MLTIRGGTLAGMACAARLAKLGHPVRLDLAGGPLGGRWAAERGVLPPVVTLPATWRDLFKKSGRPLEAELARAGLAMVEAPPAVHRFDDGAELALPTERGRQFAVLSGRYGEGVAERWRDLLDSLDGAWLAARRFGVERPDAPRTAEDRRALLLDRPLADVADRAGHPHLARIVLDLAPVAGTRSRRAPGLLATRLVVERTFGRWQVIDDAGRAQPGGRLIELLEGRLATRRVEIVDGVAGEPAVDCLPRRPRWGRAALAPAVGQAEVDVAGEGAAETVDHTGPAPVPGWRIPGRELTWDFSRALPDVEWGVEPRSARAVLRRAPVASGRPAASSCSPAGPEPWAELASAALAVYEVHERLTGEDARPTNRARR
ncbi:MAG TPA: hypothetical protein VLQ67_00250 [Arachnia sp.]|nr:hypothetical protein [Arachnia sp.]